MERFLLLSLDSEHYTDLSSDVVTSLDEAVGVLKEREKAAGHDNLTVTTSKDGVKARITLRDNDPTDEYFVVAEMMPMPEKRYAVAWWHAYDGVSFDLKGASDEITEAADQLDFYVRNYIDEKYLPDYYESGDTTITCDTDNEWEMLEVIDLKEVA